jgi:O-acetyl-ADP-ribose deacetylase (regulator of RNase III)
MGRIHFVNGNVLSARDPVLAEGCNCRGAHNAGIARQISARWPEAVRTYQEACREGRFTPGTALFVQIQEEPRRVLAFLGTQLNFGPRSFVPYAKAEWVEQAIRQLAMARQAWNLPSVAMPPIGSGLGGLNWENQVLPAIRRGIDGYNLTINVYFLTTSKT